MKIRRAATALLAAATLSAAATAVGADDAPSHRPAVNTRANYTPVERFQPLPASPACAEVAGAPFLLPPGYDQQVVAQEGEGGTTNLWDMNTQNESGWEAGRYVYRTHETAPSPTAPASAVSVTDLRTGTTTVLAQRSDWERFDGIVWTPHGTLLAAEETGRAAVPDPAFSNARAGLVYELFVDPHDPSRLRTDDPRDDVAPFDDGIAARPALGSKAHEGMRFDRRGYHYGITEADPGSIFRFVPDRRGDLSQGHLQALKTDNGHDGTGTWVDILGTAAGVDAQPAAIAMGANAYNRPEDVETGQSTGVDRNNGGNTLYVAMTGTEEVLAVDLSRQDQPYAYDYVFNSAHSQTSSGTPNATAEFDSPDNLALDRRGNLAITEDPPAGTQGADVWVAAPRGGRHQPARTVHRFASLQDCGAEPTGIYFALAGTKRFTRGTPLGELVRDDSLLVNRQHARQGTNNDQLVAIAPV
jgi:hypothetical protein